MSADDLPSVWLDPPPAIESDWLRAGARYDDVVVGAGLTGLVTACLLARAGHRVAVLRGPTGRGGDPGNTTAKAQPAAGHVSVEHRPPPFRTGGGGVPGRQPGGVRLGGPELLRRASRSRSSSRDAYTYAGDDARPPPRSTRSSPWPGGWVCRFETDRGSPSCPSRPSGRIRLAGAGPVRPDGPAQRPGHRAARAGAGCPDRGRPGRGSVSVDRPPGPPCGPHGRPGDRGPRRAGHRGALPGSWPLLRQGRPAALVRAGLPGGPRGHPARDVSVDGYSRPGRCARPGAGDDELLLWSAGTATRSVVSRRGRRANSSPTSPDGPSATSPAPSAPTSGRPRTTNRTTRCRSSASCREAAAGIWLATGYSKWGMTNAIAAALHITAGTGSAETCPGPRPWAPGSASRPSRSPASKPTWPSGWRQRRAGWPPNSIS